MIGSRHENDRQAATHSVRQRLGRAALTLGSGYQANRDALEPVLRVLADVMALAAMLHRARPGSRAAPPPPGHGTGRRQLPANAPWPTDHDDDRSAQKGTTR
jgi:hypothetical protein